MNYSEQILKARFEQLPEGVKEAIIATPWKDKLAQIASKHRLHIDQADRLGKETVIVMFGLDHPDNLIYNIAKNVDVSEEKAEAIAEDLNREIFLKVRESLKKIFEEKNKDDKTKESVAKAKEDSKATETEEIPSREDILKEIEDKEHHNLPMLNTSELHLEVQLPQLPSEIKVFEKSVDLPNQKTTDDVKTEIEKPAEANTVINQGESEQERKIFEKVNSNSNLEARPSSNKEGAIKTMPGDIFKIKMSGAVNVPKETVEIKDSKVLSKVKLADIGKKIDPYRENIK